MVLYINIKNIIDFNISFNLIVSIISQKELTYRMSKQKSPQGCKKSTNILQSCFVLSKQECIMNKTGFYWFF